MSEEVSEKLREVGKQVQKLQVREGPFQPPVPKGLVAKPPVAPLPPSPSPQLPPSTPAVPERPSPAPSISPLEEAISSGKEPSQGGRVLFRLSGKQPVTTGGSTLPKLGPIPQALGIRPIEVAPITPSSGFFPLDPIASELYKTTRKPTLSGNEDD